MRQFPCGADRYRSMIPARPVTPAIKMDHLPVEKIRIAFVGAQAALVFNNIVVQNVIHQIDVVVVYFSIVVHIEHNDIDGFAFFMPAVAHGIPKYSQALWHFSQPNIQPVFARKLFDTGQCNFHLTV